MYTFVKLDAPASTHVVIWWWVWLFLIMSVRTSCSSSPTPPFTVTTKVQKTLLKHETSVSYSMSDSEKFKILILVNYGVCCLSAGILFVFALVGLGDRHLFAANKTHSAEAGETAASIRWMADGSSQANERWGIGTCGLWVWHYQRGTFQKSWYLSASFFFKPHDWAWLGSAPHQLSTPQKVPIPKRLMDMDMDEDLSQEEKEARSRNVAKIKSLLARSRYESRVRNQ